MKFYYVLSVIALFLGTNCFADEQITKPELLTPPTDANLCVYRIVTYPLLWKSPMKVDDTKIANLGNHSYTCVYLAEGSHKISISGNPLLGVLSLKLNVGVRDGTKTYLRIGGGVGGGYGISYSSELRVVSAESGSREIQECKFIVLN